MFQQMLEYYEVFTPEISFKCPNDIKLFLEQNDELYEHATDYILIDLDDDTNIDCFEMYDKYNCYDLNLMIVGLFNNGTISMIDSNNYETYLIFKVEGK